MEDEFGLYPIILRSQEIDENALLDFFKKCIESNENKDKEGNYKFHPYIKGVIFDILTIIKNNKQSVYSALTKEIKERKLKVYIDPYTNNLYDSIKRSENKNKGIFGLLNKLIKEKFLRESDKRYFEQLVVGGRNKGIKFSLSLNNNFLYNFLRLQKMHNVDGYVIPYVPLDPPTYRTSLLKNVDLIKESSSYLSRVLFVKDPNIIPVICVTKNMIQLIYGKLDKQNKKIIRRVEWSQILEPYLSFDFNKIIIKIDNFSQYERNTKDFEAIRYFYNEVKSLYPDIEIIFSDFNEFSYKLTLDGLRSYGTCICKTLFRGGGAGRKPTEEEKLGKYYVEKDMEYYLINKIDNKLDNCFFCKLLKSEPLDKTIKNKLWEYVRLGHFINSKNNEARKINNAKARGQLKVALRDMYAESENLKSLA